VTVYGGLVTFATVLAWVDGLAAGYPRLPVICEGDRLLKHCYEERV